MEPCYSVSTQTVGLPMAGKLIGMGRWRKEGGERERERKGEIGRERGNLSGYLSSGETL